MVREGNYGGTYTWEGYGARESCVCGGVGVGGGGKGEGSDGKRKRERSKIWLEWYNFLEDNCLTKNHGWVDLTVGVGGTVAALSLLKVVWNHCNHNSFLLQGINVLDHTSSY